MESGYSSGEILCREKILIAVFPYTGNTRQAAQTIQRKTGGTLIEIEPETPYSKDYRAVVKQGRGRLIPAFCRN